MQKVKLKAKWKKLIIDLILIAFIVLFIVSFYHLINYKINEKKMNNQIDIIKNNVTIDEIKQDSSVEIIKQNEEINETNPYWDYIKMNLINVNFNNLKTINNDVKGWIQVNGTNINYPFVQTKNNKYYLDHSFDKKYNSAGWLFLDYRNNLSNPDDKNTIIYGHSMINKTMFGTLRDILTTKWQSNPDNYIVKLSTEHENTLWQVFSIYHIPTTNDYIKTDFKYNQEFKIFAEKLKERSVLDFHTDIQETDRILTLSTCYKKVERIVLHAKLIKREIKEN